MNKYKGTMRYCYVAYIVQAIVNNLLPLFFVIFSNKFGISTVKLGSLVLINFSLQLITDIAATKFGDRWGYRKSMLFAHAFSATGLVLAAILPFLFRDAFWGLVAATFFSAVGGGLIEVMVSPLMDSLQLMQKSSAMSFLHSFYCWGQVAVVLLTTVFIKIFGQQYWFLLPPLWALIPFVNTFMFIKTPLPETIRKEERTPLRQLFKKPIFILMIVIMVCAGASELSMAQWASFFAEKGLGISKMLGDLLGPCAFALFMGVARMIHGIYGERLPLKLSIIISAALGVVCYALAGLSLNPILALTGCAICGFSVGIMWPGTLSLASQHFSKGGTAMFGILAMAGDLGCSIGPWLTGFVAEISEKSRFITERAFKTGLDAEQLAIKFGLLVGIIFPLFMVVSLLLNKKGEVK